MPFSTMGTSDCLTTAHTETKEAEGRERKEMPDPMGAGATLQRINASVCETISRTGDEDVPRPYLCRIGPDAGPSTAVGQ